MRSWRWRHPKALTRRLGRCHQQQCQCREPMHGAVGGMGCRGSRYLTMQWTTAHWLQPSCRVPGALIGCWWSGKRERTVQGRALRVAAALVATAAWQGPQLAFLGWRNLRCFAASLITSSAAPPSPPAPRPLKRRTKLVAGGAQGRSGMLYVDKVSRRWSSTPPHVACSPLPPPPLHRRRLPSATTPGAASPQGAGGLPAAQRCGGQPEEAGELGTHWPTLRPDAA